MNPVLAATLGLVSGAILGAVIALSLSKTHKVVPSDWVRTDSAADAKKMLDESAAAMQSLREVVENAIDRIDREARLRYEAEEKTREAVDWDGR